MFEDTIKKHLLQTGVFGITKLFAANLMIVFSLTISFSPPQYEHLACSIIQTLNSTAGPVEHAGLWLLRVGKRRASVTGSGIEFLFMVIIEHRSTDACHVSVTPQLCHNPSYPSTTIFSNS